MKRILRVALPWVGCLALGVGLAGCKVSACPDSQSVDGGKSTTKDNCIQFEPTVEYRGSARTATQAWSSGKSVSVRNHNGKLVVLSDAASTDVQVSGIPFTRDGTSDAEKQSATAHLAAMAPPSVAPDAAGNVIVDAPGGGVDGYELTVHLPTAFDGTLTANNDNGELQYSGTPSSTGNLVHSDNGDVTAGVGATANVSVTAKTDLGVVAFRGTGWMTPMVSADGMTGSASLGTGAGTLNVTSGNGDVVVQLP
jgi:hypothetical protein